MEVGDVCVGVWSGELFIITEDLGDKFAGFYLNSTERTLCGKDSLELCYMKMKDPKSIHQAKLEFSGNKH